MFRFLAPAAVAAAAWSATSVFAQTSSTTTETIADRSPSENVRGGAVSERAPGNIVQDALARHSQLAADRLAFQRGSGDLGNGSGESSGSSSDSSSGSSSGSDMFGGLLGDILGGGLLGGVGDLLGGSSGSTTDGSSTGTDGTSDIPSNITPEVLALLEQFGININDVFPSGSSSSDSSSTTGTSGSVNQLKGTSTFQTNGTDTTTEEEPKFVVRWGNALLGALFDAIQSGVSLNAFVNLLEDIFRPLLIPDSTSDGTTSKSATSSVRAAELFPLSAG